jgi:hypothetical protein
MFSAVGVELNVSELKAAAVVLAIRNNIRYIYLLLLQFLFSCSAAGAFHQCYVFSRVLVSSRKILYFSSVRSRGLIPVVLL